MGTYSAGEWPFGGFPEPGEAHPDDPDALRDRVEEERGDGMDVIARTERRCRECHRELGFWHDKDCMVGRSGPGRVRDVEVLEFVSFTTYRGAVHAERDWLERLYPYIADISGAPALKAEVRARLAELGGQ